MTGTRQAVKCPNKLSNKLVMPVQKQALQMIKGMDGC